MTQQQPGQPGAGQEPAAEKERHTDETAHGQERAASAEAASASPSGDGAASPSGDGATADVGVMGMAVMGSSLARNIAHKGYRTAIFNRTHAKT